MQEPVELYDPENVFQAHRWHPLALLRKIETPIVHVL